MDTLTTALNIKYMYTFFGGKKREKLDFILEPLQAMLQLSMLSFCPIGSKLTINGNLLGIQLPGVSQGIVRFFNEDVKEDLYYLSNVFRRYILYYNFMKLDTRYRPLFELLVKLSKGGLNKLIQTYANNNKINVCNTLRVYKMMLNKPELFDDTGTKDEEYMADLHSAGGGIHNLSLGNGDTDSTKHNTNIDNIFDKIVNIYSQEELTIIYNALILMEKAETDTVAIELINGLNMIMGVTYSKIKKWINENIAL